MVSPSSTPPMSERDKRDAAVAELLSTEATYVSDMKLLVDVFVLPLERWAKDLEAERDSGAARDQSSVASDLTQHDCTLIFANVKQLANFNRQFLVDLRRAYGEPDPSGHDGMVSPVFRDSGEWKRVTGGRDDDKVAAATAAAAAAAAAASNRLLDDDPFKPPAAPDVDRGPRQMLEVFLKSAPFLKMYSLYVNNFDRARERLTSLERDNLSFAAFLTACERQKPCRGLRLRDFLILPVQRIPRYRLLLETILQHTPIASTMHSQVEESLTTMGGIAAKINEGVSLQRQKHKVYELQQEFGGANFVTASRIFIREGDLSKVARSGVEKLHFVLFNDLLVYGQAKKRRGVLRGGGKGKGLQLYHHRREINLSKCYVVDAPSYGARSSSFLGETGMLVVSEEKCFMVMASNAVEKDAWLRAIRLCMRDLSTNVETRERMCGSQEYDDEGPRSPVSSQGRSSRWSVGSGNSPPSASAPRSVWVPGKDGHKSMRLVDFSLPPWAGVRTSCGCLSHTELIWGREGLAPTGGGGGGGMAAGLAAALGIGNSQQQQQQQPQQPRQPTQDNDNVDNTGQSGGAPQPSSDGGSPRKVSCVIKMRPFEPMGLRLRDVHPGCGGGVVVVGFEPKSPGKRAGMQQGDRITEVDGIPVSKTSDIVWALMQPRMGADTTPGRAVHLAVLRGFPKSEKPWLQPLMVDPSPLPTTLSPPSSAVESRSDEEPPAAALTAPGCRTFFSADGTPVSRLGFGRSNSCGGIGGGGGGGGGSGVRHRGGGPSSVGSARGCGGCVSLPKSMLVEEAGPAEILPAAVDMLPPPPPPVPPPPRASYASYDSQPTMHAAQIAHDLHESRSMQPRVAGLLIAPPSPETKADYSGGDFSMDSNFSGEYTIDSADSSAGAALRGPAPNQANDNAGGDPAKPFTMQPVQSLRRQPQYQQHEQQEEGGRLPTGSMGVGSALAACWTCQTDDPFQVSDEEVSKPTEYSHADVWASPVVETLKDAVAGACVGDSDDGEGGVGRRERGMERTQGVAEEEDREDEEEGEDSRSGSSEGSSMFLTAVSPSRIPPPLISMASTLPPPPISMASSVVSGSFSNPWYSPTNSNAGTPDTSMSWLKPLPPPPPRRDSADVQVGTAQPLSSSSRLSPPPPTASARGNMALAYPSGRWVQTPPYGEPKGSPAAEIATVVEKARGF